MVDMWAYIEGKEITKPEALIKWHSKKDEDLGVDPRLYNWQKWEQSEEEENRKMSHKIGMSRKSS